MKKSKNLESLKSEVFHLDGNQSNIAYGGGWWSELIGKLSLKYIQYEHKSKDGWEKGVLVDDNNNKVAEKF